MPPDPFKMAAEGWKIISRPGSSRENARNLLRRLAEAMNANLAGIIFRDANTEYQWKEQVQRITAASADKGISHRWQRDFPFNPSVWFFESEAGDDERFGPVLDLLARQWLHLNKAETSLPDRARLLKSVIEEKAATNSWIAVSRPSRIVAALIPRLGFSRSPLLILGPTGSGKGHLALLIHQYGPDPSLPISSWEEEQSEGTLLVRDWSAVSIEEARLMLTDPRRLIACLTPNGKTESPQHRWKNITGGRGQSLTVPALKDRKEDIPTLAGRFLDETLAASGRGRPSLSSTAVDALLAYSWPGNARELKETIAGIMKQFSEDQTSIGFGDLPPAIRGALHKPLDSSFPERLIALEYEALKEELSRQRGNMARTARALGLTPRQVSWRVRKYGLHPEDFKLR